MTTPPGPFTPRRTSLSRQVDAVVRASRALVGVAAESLGEVGDVVTVPQFRVLVLLHTRGPLNLTSVAAELGVNPSNASRTCDRLIKAQLLDRRESAVDRRHVTLTIRPAGRRLVEKVTEHRRAAIERVLRSMKAGERQMVATALELFAVAAGEPDTTVGVLWPPDAD